MKYITTVKEQYYRVTIPGEKDKNGKREPGVQKQFPIDKLNEAIEFRNKYLLEKFGSQEIVDKILKIPVLPRQGYISKTTRTEKNGTKIPVIVGRLKINGKLKTFSRSIDKYGEKKAKKLIEIAISNVLWEELKINSYVNMNEFDKCK